MILPEIVTAGIYNSDIAAKNTSVSKKRKTSMFELELPLEEGGISHIDSNAAPITPNMIICAKPGQVRHTKFPFKCFYVHMILHSGRLYDTLMNTPDYFETGKSETYKEIFRELIKHYNALSDSEDIILQSLVLKLIYTIEKDCHKAVKHGGSASVNPTVEEALKYIKEHLTEELTLKTVSSSVSLSPTHFHQTFKRAVGKPLREYIEEQRLKKAIKLLTTTEKTLTDIAYESGFSSQSYFSFVFKRKMKKAPREYMRDIYKKYEM